MRARRWSLLAMCLCMLLLSVPAAAITWPVQMTASQSALRAYVELLNQSLTQLGARPVNSLFECYPTFASFGITDQENADAAEKVEMIAAMSAVDVDRLTVSYSADMYWDDSREAMHVIQSEVQAFARITAACIHAASPEAITLEEAQKEPNAFARRVEAKRKDSHGVISFEDPISEERGDHTRVYWEYSPNRYNDGKALLVMTLVFARSDALGGLEVTPAPVVDEYVSHTNDDGDPDWAGYYQELGEQNYFEYFVTPTPEPDSAVFAY